jgi:hypothetical protein
MDKKTIIISAVIVAGVGAGYILYNRSKTAKDSAKKNPDSSSQPDRKKLYDDIYINLVNYITKNNQGTTFMSVLGDTYYNNDYNSYNPNNQYGSGYDSGYGYNNDFSWNQQMQEQQRLQQDLRIQQEEWERAKVYPIPIESPTPINVQPITKRSVTPLTLQQINDAALKFYNSILPDLNKMTIQELETYLSFIKAPNDIVNDPFKYKEISSLITKYPKIALD